MLRHIEKEVTKVEVSGIAALLGLGRCRGRGLGLGRGRGRGLCRGLNNSHLGPAPAWRYSALPSVGVGLSICAKG